MAERIYGPLAESGGRMLARYSKPEMELLVRVLEEIRDEQEAQTERVRAMLKKGQGGRSDRR